MHCRGLGRLVLAPVGERRPFQVRGAMVEEVGDSRTPRPMNTSPAALRFVAVAAWCTAVVGGLCWMSDYAASPGPAAKAASRWPDGATIPRDTGLPTLVLFIHPQCPCTAATLEELDRLLGHVGDRVATSVLVYSDEALGPEWTRSSSWSRAQRIPRVRVVADPLGGEAALFGAATSGQACLYAPEGTLLFSGGLTPARGHEGDSLGGAALQSLILGVAAPPAAPVFGCPLSSGEP